MARFMPTFFPIAYYNRKEISLAFSKKIGTNPGEKQDFFQNLQIKPLQTKGILPQMPHKSAQIALFSERKKSSLFSIFSRNCTQKQASKVLYMYIFLNHSALESEISDSERGLFDKLSFCQFDIFNKRVAYFLHFYNLSFARAQPIR